MKGQAWPKTVVLALWSLFFLWLLVSGKVNVYIGPRTYWVVVFGAACLVAATVGNLVLSRREQDAGESRSWGGYALMLLPIVLVLLVPEPSLGSLAASRKASGGVVSAAAEAPLREPGDEISFQEISYAIASEGYAAALGIGDGYEVDLTGFVAGQSEGVADAIDLTRFSIFCCAADAVPYTVPIRMPEGTSFQPDTWLRVRGSLARDGATYVVVADQVEAVEVPSRPYI